MALCRFSDYKCDLYIYESQNGIECHVAARRYVDEPKPPRLPAGEGESAWDRWAVDYAEHCAKLEELESVSIGLPQDGTSRTFGDWAGLLAFVAELRELGYSVPDWVVESIEVEVAAEMEEVGSGGFIGGGG